MDSSQPLDPRKTIFVGGVPRPLRAGKLFVHFTDALKIRTIRRRVAWTRPKRWGIEGAHMLGVIKVIF